jgi:Domain of unknown function (DUF397)
MNREALVGAEFRKARDCSDKSCVEVAITDGVIGLRDSKDNGRGPVLAFTPEEWTAFLRGARRGEFDWAPGR